MRSFRGRLVLPEQFKHLNRDPGELSHRQLICVPHLSEDLEKNSCSCNWGTGNMLLGETGCSLIGPISHVIPMTNISQAPRSLPVGSVLGHTTCSATTFPIRHPSNQTDDHILHVVEGDVEILDGCHTTGCGMTSSLMRKCQHWQKSLFCSRKCPSPPPPLLRSLHTSVRVVVQDWMYTWGHVSVCLKSVIRRRSTCCFSF